LRSAGPDNGSITDATPDYDKLKYWHLLLNDRWAIESVFKGLRGGFFVEAGAANGVYGSASLVLERKFDWSGICCEPIDAYQEQLRKWRTCEVDDRCLWSSSGETLTFTHFPTLSGLSGIEGVNKNEIALHKEGTEAERVQKETVTLHDLLEQHGAPETIHYICLDVEGAERPVLEAFDFAGPYRVLAISIEGRSCDDLMAAAGYRRVKNPFSEKDFERYFVHPSLEDEVRDLLAD
jgi:FkbM family methyltransferase